MSKIDKTQLKNSINNKPKQVMIKYNINITSYSNINLLGTLTNKNSFKQIYPK